MTEPLTDARIAELLADARRLIGMDTDLPPDTPLGHKRLEVLRSCEAALLALAEHRRVLREAGPLFLGGWHEPPCILEPCLGCKVRALLGEEADNGK